MGVGARNEAAPNEPGPSPALSSVVGGHFKDFGNCADVGRHRASAMRAVLGTRFRVTWGLAVFCRQRPVLFFLALFSVVTVVAARSTPSGTALNMRRRHGKASHHRNLLHSTSNPFPSLTYSSTMKFLLAVLAVALLATEGQSTQNHAISPTYSPQTTPHRHYPVSVSAGNPGGPTPRPVSGKTSAFELSSAGCQALEPDRCPPLSVDLTINKTFLDCTFSSPSPFE
ncbi:hypothetical protein BDK51DRAFT_37342 [Blyttiomyces helicus]|uniref:Uncharacterized protein n=1 Tax=Blyttiomyces helicus TaxID=388810 RepID=A0A4P9W8P9_9FUNG|nr:hypothetical protein BDK51DRAFT_37342 [Blyttiomyces helicus]|eukprot:RKO88911.1 hypothetical protein BDK51DRAFT_37342 [Blyttiomyces helicus]